MEYNDMVLDDKRREICNVLYEIVNIFDTYKLIDRLNDILVGKDGKQVRENLLTSFRNVSDNFSEDLLKKLTYQEKNTDNDFCKKCNIKNKITELFEKSSVIQKSRDYDLYDNSQKCNIDGFHSLITQLHKIVTPV